MSRAVLALDRTLAFVLGLLLLAVGAAAVAWWAGELDRVWPTVPDTLRLGAASSAVSAPWWPWAAGVAGIVAMLLGLWWLIAHVPRRNVGTLALPGTPGRGSLRIDPGAAATTAAQVLAEAPGVRSVRGTVHDDRGELVAALSATIEPTADLATIVDRAERVSAELGHVLGIEAARGRVQLSVARRGRRLPRAE
ncbi:hypothetical protein [Georgenia yuyongxinii]|uniref:Alkaline shock response membrane anchor protein AmaP n=1 Tax=Georgenia yuyongxinii TaxID=2589797 RepID=A0A552WMT3_9MICO|nr:hypothetical protein [Georgenia yuyongxinii]TRW44105.1 hypothetical protein FJ693_14865 [Georgenia yuyongxinii]